MESKAAHRYSVLQPAWGVLCEILTERRAQCIESLRRDGKEDHDMWCGRIAEIDETMDILPKLGLEAKIK